MLALHPLASAPAHAEERRVALDSVRLGSVPALTTFSTGSGHASSSFSEPSGVIAVGALGSSSLVGGLASSMSWPLSMLRRCGGGFGGRSRVLPPPALAEAPPMQLPRSSQWRHPLDLGTSAGLAPDPDDDLLPRESRLSGVLGPAVDDRDTRDPRAHAARTAADGPAGGASPSTAPSMTIASSAAIAARSRRTAPRRAASSAPSQPPLPPLHQLAPSNDSFAPPLIASST